MKLLDSANLLINSHGTQFIFVLVYLVHIYSVLFPYIGDCIVLILIQLFNNSNKYSYLLYVLSDTCASHILEHMTPFRGILYIFAYFELNYSC